MAERADKAAKPMTLEQLARSETATAEQLELKRKQYREGQKRLATDVPERFLLMARQLKDGVSRFNGAARLDRILRYRESPAVTTQDLRPAADLLVEVTRDHNSLLLAVRSLWRMAGDDAALIEAEGVLGVPPATDRVALRIQGLYPDGQLRWRITSGGLLVDTPLDELPERMVAAVATGELARLWVSPPFLQGGSA